MRHTFLLLAILLASANIMAQGHLQFMGIPIDGNITKFGKELEAKGFTPIRLENGLIYNGEFTGQEAMVALTADSEDNVYSVIVSFRPNKEWKNLVSTYDYYKELYTIKYGDTTTSAEENPALDDSNLSLMLALEQDKATYLSYWEVENGNITIMITKAEDLEGMVVIVYNDDQSFVNKALKDLDDI